MKRYYFADREHEKFFYSMMRRVGVYDNYHIAFFYTAGICEETREHITDLFDFEEHLIKPEGLRKGWQTGGSVRVTRLAFNLWNGWMESGKESLSTPQNLFDCGFAPYLLEAICMRYPDYCREIRDRDGRPER